MGTAIQVPAVTYILNSVKKNRKCMTKITLPNRKLHMLYQMASLLVPSTFNNVDRKLSDTDYIPTNKVGA